MAATYLGGSEEDFAYALQANTDGTVLLAGFTTTSDFLITQDSPLSAAGLFRREVPNRRSELRRHAVLDSRARERRQFPGWSGGAG